MNSLLRRGAVVIMAAALFTSCASTGGIGSAVTGDSGSTGGSGGNGTRLNLTAYDARLSVASDPKVNLVASPYGASCYYIPNGALGGGDELGVFFYFLILGGSPYDVPAGLSVTGSSDTGLYTRYYTSPNNQALSVAQFTLRPWDFGRLHTIKIVVDSANQVAETTKSDNTIFVTVRLPYPRPTSTIDPLPCIVSRQPRYIEKYPPW